MKRNIKAAIVGGGLQKSVTLSDLDEILDLKISDGNGEATPQDLFKIVAWVFWCIELRANLVSGVPFLVYPLNVEDDEEGKDVPWGIEMRQIFWKVEAWLALKGAAYVLKRYEGRTLEKLQVLDANTVRLLEYDDDGPISFEQRVGTRRRVYPADQMIYFNVWSPDTDIGPGVARGSVSQKPSALIDALNEYGGAFFRNGAVPLVFLTTEGTVPKVEKERILANWIKKLQGVTRSFRTEILERGLTPTVVGTPPKDLAMPELEESKRTQILSTFGIPPGYAERMNYAERMLMEASLWTNTLIPQIETWVEPVWNEQLFYPLGQRASFQYRKIEALQYQELAKSESAHFLIGGVMKIAFEAGVTSAAEFRTWVSRIAEWADMPPLDPNWTPVEKEDRVPPALQAGNEQPEEETTDDGTPSPEDRIESRLPKALLDELDRWERKAVSRIKEGYPSKALEFASDVIPADVHRMIVHSLEHAATLGDVVEVFKAARGEQKQIHFIPEGQGDPLPPVPDVVTISDADIDRSLKSWDKLMPDFAGLLDAEVIHRENYDA